MKCQCKTLFQHTVPPPPYPPGSTIPDHEYVNPFYTDIIYHIPGPSQAGGPGGLVPPHFLSDQLTLSQPGGAHYPHPVLRAPPDFQTLRRPCIQKKVAYNDNRCN